MIFQKILVISSLVSILVLGCAKPNSETLRIDSQVEKVCVCQTTQDLNYSCKCDPCNCKENLSEK